VAYPMVRLPMTVSEAEGTSAVFNLCNTHRPNSGNIAFFKYSMVTHKLESVCDLNFIVKGEGTSQGHRQSCALEKW